MILGGSSSGSSSSSNQYQVEAILDRRVVGGNIEYYIKWLGWTARFNSWLSEADMGGCTDLIREFNGIQ